MRAAILLLLVLLAPVAGAQGPLPSAVTVRADPPSVPLPPAGPPIPVPFAVEIPCEAGLVTTGFEVAYFVERQPSWANVVLSPTRETVQPGPCAGAIRLVGRLLVSASDQAPAFVAEPIVLAARAYDAIHGEVQGRTLFPVAAGFFSIVEVQAPRQEVNLPPGAVAAVPLKATNFGNGNTKLDFSVDPLPEGVTVQLPAPVVLQSRQAGGTHVSLELPLMVHRASDARSPGNDVVTVRWRSAYALDPNLPGDRGTVSFTLRPDGPVDGTLLGDASLDEARRQVPAATMPLVALVVLLAALAWRRRSA